VGAKRTIIHLYNSTSPAQRRVVFWMMPQRNSRVAVRGAQLIYERLPLLKDPGDASILAGELQRNEVEFAKDVCEAVMDVWQPTPERKIILNLPTRSR
jgi:2-isopropylmalate synthase